MAQRRDFIDEEDLHTFEGWERYQAFDPSTPREERLAGWAEVQRDMQRQPPPVGRMRLKSLAQGEYRYAIAVDTPDGLRLGAWVRWSPRREAFVFLPRRDGRWNPHASYHRDGTLHQKDYDRVSLRQRRQPLVDPAAFCGVEPLGDFAGYGPKSVGALCEPGDFSGVVTVPRGVLGPRDGRVRVQLVQPGQELPPVTDGEEVVVQEVFRDTAPWIAIGVIR